MKSLVILLDANKPNMKNYGKQICMYIYGQIGS